MAKGKNNIQTSCDTCQYYFYDDDYECYVCDMDLDEDEMAHFMLDSHFDCPFYRNGDEYRIARKQ